MSLANVASNRITISGSGARGEINTTAVCSPSHSTAPPFSVNAIYFRRQKKCQMLSSMENMFCNIVQAELWRGKVLGKNWLNITFLRIKVLEQIVLQELRPSPAIHIILIDMTGFYRGEGRGFLWFYTKIIFVLSSETALDVRPFCVKICQLGLIFQFSILLELEGSLSLDWVSGPSQFSSSCNDTMGTETSG